MTAKSCFEETSQPTQVELLKAAHAATRVLAQLEPQLGYPDGGEPLFLQLQNDAKGMVGDVRDVLCWKEGISWEIGLSCKLNNEAVKHSRLSGTIDFGQEWFQTPCTSDYFDTVVPIFDELRRIRDGSKDTALWSDVEHKQERFYMPILDAFIDELKRLDSAYPKTIPERLVRYLIGRHDFYKVVADLKHKTTRIEGVNFSASLNRPSEESQPNVKIPRLELPTHFYDISYRDSSKTTIEVVCDKGWTLSMRIHSAKSKVEPSLKFDVNLVSLPHNLHSQIAPW